MSRGDLPFRYAHSGLQIASAIELEAWEAFRTPARGAPDVAIVISDEPCPDWPSDGTTVVEGDSARFVIDGVGGWDMQGGRRIVLHPSLSADPRELQLFTLGSAWGLLGYQRGHAMWHGSAVSNGAGLAMLFCGTAGEGKSTMAAAMLDAGATLIADDLSRVELRDGWPSIHPSSSRIKLWNEAIGQLGWQERIVERDWMREDKFHCAVPRHAAGEGPRPLGAIVVLASGEREECVFEQLRGSEALTQVLASTVYRPEALDAMDRWTEQGALAARILGQVPVYRLTRPRNLASLREGALQAADLLDTLG